MKVLFAIGALSALSQCCYGLLSVTTPDWPAYKSLFNKNYSEEEDVYRQQIFTRNLQNINDHNERFNEKLESYKKGINQFTDQTQEDRRKIGNALGTPQRKSLNAIKKNSKTKMLMNVPIPESFSWLERGAVTPVKNQKHCGSCYAFAANVAMEAQLFFQTGQLRNLSEQNLIDCSPNNDGCNGGFPAACFEYALDQGLMLQEEYEYLGKQSSNCSFAKENSVFPIEDFTFIDAGDEDLIIRMIATNGPVAVSLDSRNFHDYSEGILDDTEGCNVTDHTVGLVGYGVENGKPYYLAKNSWGDWWGENGYVRIARNVNYCYLADFAVTPLF